MELRFIREKECLHLTGLGKTTRYQLEKEGKFPERKRIGKNVTGWLSTDIEAWINERSSEKYIPQSHIEDRLHKKPKGE